MWIQNGMQAHLKTPFLRGTLPLARPDRGLGELQIDLQVDIPDGLNRASLMQVHRSSGSLADETPEESFIRDTDLVVRYATSSSDSVRRQVYWRELPVGERSYAGLEVVVLVETSEMDSDPSIRVLSRLQAEALLVLPSPSSGQWTTAHPPFARTGGLPTRPCAVLLRLPTSSISYVQIAAPTEGSDLSFSHESDAPGWIRVEHACFQGRLEKGVLRSSRLCGYFLPRENDREIALQLTREFNQSEPMLTV